MLCSDIINHIRKIKKNKIKIYEVGTPVFIVSSSAYKPSGDDNFFVF